LAPINAVNSFCRGFPRVLKAKEVFMKISASLRTLCVFLRLGLLALAFICLVHAPASAQTCGANCTVVYAGDDGDNYCFTKNHTACPGGNMIFCKEIGRAHV